MKHLSGHVARILTGEEQEARSDLAGLAWPSHRHVLAEIGDLLRRLASERIERSPDRARRDRVDPDSVADQILRQRAGEGGDRSLGRRIIEQAFRALVHRHRRAVDDRGALPEVRPGRLDHEEIAVEIGLEGALQLLLGDLLYLLVIMLLAGVVDEDVEPAELIDRLLHRALAEGLVADVAGNRDRPAALALDDLLRLPGVVMLAQIE